MHGDLFVVHLGHPSHQGEGEPFYIRGSDAYSFGTDSLPCFVCGAQGFNSELPHAVRNLQAYSDSAFCYQQIVEMFQSVGSHCKGRSADVKVGACETHVPNLRNLVRLILTDYRITAARIQEAMRS